MALGGGTFLTQNKVLPGSYINFVSAARASATISDRGVIAMPMDLDWGVDCEVFTVENADFQRDSLKIFGYDYTSDKLKGLRDLFKNAKTVHIFRLNSGTKAKNTYAEAIYSGICGNKLKTVIQVNVDDETKFDVFTYMDTVQVDAQTVGAVSELKNNDYVMWLPEATLDVTASTPLTGGTNAASVTGAEYQTALDKLEAYSFNTLGCVSTTEQVKDLFVQYTKRMRDEVGVKFQTVVYRVAADYEGVINVENTVAGDNVAALVYWVTGAAAGCSINKSNTNKTYDGEYTVNVEYKQSELEAGITSGKFMFHRVGDEVRVLDDINSYTSVTVDKNEDFTSNQTIRVLDQIGNDIASMFNSKYLGKVPNDEAGRVSLWGDVVEYNNQLQAIRAIENFVADDVVVEKGNDKKSVVVNNSVTPVNAMAKLYMTVIVA